MITFLMAVTGALNWGLIGLFGFNLVETLLGSMPGVEKLVYVLVGASAVYEFASHMGRCKDCARMAKK
jgi:hypothetical protein